MEVQVEGTIKQRAEQSLIIVIHEAVVVKIALGPEWFGHAGRIGRAKDCHVVIVHAAIEV
jgi:hypothetical protein